jgi:hypothetical protein
VRLGQYTQMHEEVQAHAVPKFLLPSTWTHYWMLYSDLRFVGVLRSVHLLRCLVMVLLDPQKRRLRPPIAPPRAGFSP